MPKPGFFNFKDAAEAAHVLLPQLYSTSHAFTTPHADVRKDTAARAAAAWFGTAGVIVFIISQYHPELDIHRTKESIASLLDKTQLNLDAQNLLQIITYIALLWIIPKAFECIAYIYFPKEHGRAAQAIDDANRVGQLHPSPQKMEFNLDENEDDQDESDPPSQADDDLAHNSTFEPEYILDPDYFKAPQGDDYTAWDNRTDVFARASKIVEEELNKKEHNKNQCIIL